MKTCILGVLALSTCLAACSNRVEIAAETSGSGGNRSQITGQGAAFPGGTGGSTGTGAAWPGSGKLVTADTDIAQYASVTTTSTVQNPVNTKVLEGPFFISDVINITYPLTTVGGSDCSLPLDQHTTVLFGTTNVSQFHGLRLPILAGQALCTQAGLNYNVTVLGFKPY